MENETKEETLHMMVADKYAARYRPESKPLTGELFVDSNTYEVYAYDGSRWFAVEEYEDRPAQKNTEYVTSDKLVLTDISAASNELAYTSNKLTFFDGTNYIDVIDEIVKLKQEVETLKALMGAQSNKMVEKAEPQHFYNEDGEPMDAWAEYTKLAAKKYSRENKIDPLEYAMEILK